MKSMKLSYEQTHVQQNFLKNRNGLRDKKSLQSAFVVPRLPLSNLFISNLKNFNALMVR